MEEKYSMMSLREAALEELGIEEEEEEEEEEEDCDMKGEEWEEEDVF